jgi:CheY-like chemotaxis protein
MPAHRPLVLVVDDEPAILEVLSRLLERWGYPTLTARGAGEALAAAQQQHPAVVLMDVVMPEMHGFEAARRLADTLPATRVLMMSASPLGEKLQAEYREKGYAFPLLKKPFDLDELRAALEVHGDLASAA